MFVKLINHQNLADRIKAFILAAKTSEAFRRVVLRTLTEFEKSPWNPLALEQALERFPELKIIPDTPVSYEGPDEDGLDAIDGMFREYFILMNPNTKEYNSEEAAAILGIGMDQFYTYATRRKELSGRKVGRATLYTLEEIKRFQATMKPARRPKKTETDA